MQAVGLLWMEKYSGLNLNQDKATKPQIVQIETFAKFPKIP